MNAPDPLLAEIAALLEAPAGGDDPEQLERTLTDGYARALGLESERRRLQQRLAEVRDRRQLAALRKRLESQEGSLVQLRSLLARLRERHSAAARAAAGRGVVIYTRPERTA